MSLIIHLIMLVEFFLWSALCLRISWRRVCCWVLDVVVSRMFDSVPAPWLDLCHCRPLSDLTTFQNLQRVRLFCDWYAAVLSIPHRHCVFMTMIWEADQGNEGIIPSGAFAPKPFRELRFRSRAISYARTVYVIIVPRSVNPWFGNELLRNMSRPVDLVTRF